MTKPWHFLLLVFFFFSCEKTGCERAVDEIEFLESYLNADDDVFFLTKELEKSIDYLESISDINSSATGNIFGSFDITIDDIGKWKKWLEKNCNC